MKPTPAIFQSVAKDIMRGTFAAFASDAVFTQTTGFDYATQTPTTKAPMTVKMIREEYEEREKDGQKILQGDYRLIGEFQLFTWTPEVDNTTVVHEGITLHIKNVSIDPAKAVIKLQVRRL